MQDIYPHIPDTNPVPNQYNVTAILSLLFMVPISLVAVLALMYFYISANRENILITELSLVPILLSQIPYELRLFTADVLRCVQTLS
jgi:hypothetical protein